MRAPALSFALALPSLALLGLAMPLTASPVHASPATATPARHPGTAPTPAAEAARAEIMAADRAFAAKAKEVGIGPAFRLYAEETVWMLSLGEPTQPNAALETLFPPGAELTWDPTDAAASADGSLGYSWGPSLFRMAGKDGAMREQAGRYLTIWRRQEDGSWKFTADGALIIPPTSPAAKAP
ncbi:MAG: hypothetical protein RLY86_1959 [Pseudomonadota bacterium]|jgi:ketosteroid isomerase-like protein